MKIPQLEKKREIKSCHNVNWEDNYSWIHQENILEVSQKQEAIHPKIPNIFFDYIYLNIYHI